MSTRMSSFGSTGAVVASLRRSSTVSEVAIVKGRTRQKTEIKARSAEPSCAPAHHKHSAQAPGTRTNHSYVLLRQLISTKRLQANSPSSPPPDQRDVPAARTRRTRQRCTIRA